MNAQLKAKLDLFVENNQIAKKDFFWQSILLKRLAALLYAAENKVVDCDAIRGRYELIKKSTGVFSTFRGNSAMILATLLSLSKDKDVRFSDTLAVYDLMKEVKFRASDYLAIAAYQVAANSKPDHYLQIVTRARAFYDGMKEAHPLLTGQNDYIFAAILGLSDIDIGKGLTDMEHLYGTLKPEFLSGNGVQALSHVLVLGGNPTASVDRLFSLQNAFRDRGLRLDRENTIPSLGVLSLLPVDVNEIVGGVAESYDHLRTQKGFGKWSVAKQELLLFSTALFAFEYVDSEKSGILATTISTNITNILIAQQAAVIAAAVSSAAAASAAASG